VATNLAWSLAARRTGVCYVDVDVEAPNGHIFFWPSLSAARRHTVLVPTLRGAECPGCGLCAEACQFGAIVAERSGVTVYPDLCHSCGVCARACPDDLLEETHRETGTLRRGHVGPMGFVDGALDPGESRSVPLIRAVLDLCRDDAIAVVDAPPGTSCAAVAAMEAADLVLLVCEPTPFGLHDLELSIQTCEALGLKAVALVNRSDVGDGQVRALLEARGVPLWAEVPFDHGIATACAAGALASVTVPTFASTIDRLAARVLDCDRRDAA
jgi:MinD superfamily P-loop ATPase